MANESPKSEFQATTPSPSPESDRAVRVEDLRQLIRVKRRAERLTLQQAAQQIGVSAATLSRWERQQEHNASGDAGKMPHEPDMRTLTAIMRWLGVSIERVIGGDSALSAAAPQASNSTPDKVEAHLRADRNLDATTAAALSQMFRLAYEQFTRLSGASQSSDADGDPAEH